MEGLPITEEFKTQVVQEYLQGDCSYQDLSRKYGIKLSTIRWWKQKKEKEIKRLLRQEQRKRKQEEQALVLLKNNGVSIEDLSAFSALEKGEKIRDYSVSALTDALIDSRGKISDTLPKIPSVIADLLTRIENMLKSGTTYKTASYMGDVAATEVPLGVADYKQLTAMAAQIRKELADFGCLPQGYKELAKLLTPEREPSQHLHLHQSGIRRVKPNAVKDAVIDITPAQSTAADRTAAELSSNQRRLIEDS